MGPSANVVGFDCDREVAFVTLESRTNANTTTIMPSEKRHAKASFCFVDILSVKRSRRGRPITKELVRICCLIQTKSGGTNRESRRLRQLKLQT